MECTVGSILMFLISVKDAVVFPSWPSVPLSVYLQGGEIVSFPINGVVIKTYREETNKMKLLFLTAVTADNSTITYYAIVLLPA